MKRQKVQKIGFWNDNKNQYPEFPMPEAREKAWKGKGDFLKAFRQLDQKIRNREVSFLRVTAYKGHSTCRCCGVQNGMHEIEYKNWMWPEGFMHYIEKHNIKPDQDFIDFVMAEMYGDKIQQVMDLPVPILRTSRKLVSIGDIITGFKVLKPNSLETQVLRNNYVVEEVNQQPDGYGHGPHDVYPGGFLIRARMLREDGTYNPKAKLVETLMFAGGTRGNNEKITVVGKMRRIVSFLPE